MDDKQFGQFIVELASLIRDTHNESTPDISNTLGNRTIWYEFMALLLWIATKEAQTILPKELIQTTIDTIVTTLFLRLGESATFLKTFNERTWLDVVRNRFDIYYGAWDGYRTDWGMVFKDEEAVVHSFVVLCLTQGDRKGTGIRKADAELHEVVSSKDIADKICKVMEHYRRFSERVKSVLSRFSSQVPALTQGNSEDYLIDFVAAELKKDINYLVGLGIKLDKGKLTARTGGAAWAGYEAFTGDWLSALVIGGISLFVGGLTNGYKRIKLMEMKQKWMDRLSGLNQEQLNYLAAGLQRKYPLLLGQFQNLLQAGQG